MKNISGKSLETNLNLEKADSPAVIFESLIEQGNINGLERNKRYCEIHLLNNIVYILPAIEEDDVHLASPHGTHSMYATKETGELLHNPDNRIKPSASLPGNLSETTYISKGYIQFIDGIPKAYEKVRTGKEYNEKLIFNSCRDIGLSLRYKINGGEIFEVKFDDTVKYNDVNLEKQIVIDNSNPDNLRIKGSFHTTNNCDAYITMRSDSNGNLITFGGALACYITNNEVLDQDIVKDKPVEWGNYNNRFDFVLNQTTIFADEVRFNFNFEYKRIDLAVICVSSEFSKPNLESEEFKVLCYRISEYIYNEFKFYTNSKPINEYKVSISYKDENKKIVYKTLIFKK